MPLLRHEDTVVNKIIIGPFPNRAYNSLGLGNEIPNKNPYSSLMVIGESVKKSAVSG